MTVIDCALYVEGKRDSGPGALAIQEISAEAVRDRPDAFVWLGLYEPTSDELAEASATFGLHELAVEDAHHAGQRPKLEHYDDTLFLTLKTVEYLEKTEKITYGELLIFVGAWYVVVVRHGKATELSTLRAHLEARPDLLRCGPGAVLHEVVDRVTDNYEAVLDDIDHDVVEVEEEVFSDTKNDPTERIYNLKREVLFFHGAIAPLLDAVVHLHSDDLPHIADMHRPYFRDIHDHLIREEQRAEGMRELLTNVLQANLSRIQVQQNIDMRKISAWVAIFVAPTLIAGVYGMNFENMPELRHRLGYFIVIGSMVGLMSVIYFLFRRSKWL